MITPDSGAAALDGLGLQGRQLRWLVTGAAGFIGSHLVDVLLRAQQRVVAVDNFSTGHERNLRAVLDRLPEEARSRYQFIEGDLCYEAVVRRAVEQVDLVLHQAALGSVPRSFLEPLRSFSANVDAFVKLAIAAKDAGIKRFVYASSSSVYGDNVSLPKVESATGRPLSPYAATKAADELFADVLGRCYGMSFVGLRYFNVFGPRQDPLGPYSAVIPRWIMALMDGQLVRVNGDGETSRDFCYVANAVQANLRAALVPLDGSAQYVFNIAVGRRTTLMELFEQIRERIGRAMPAVRNVSPVFEPFREGDVRHSLADVSHASKLLGYAPTHTLQDGLDETVGWYLEQQHARTAGA